MGTTALISGVPCAQEAPVSLPPNGFLARDAQFAELDALLRRGRLVTLTGPPGAGKSRLLVEYLIRNGLDPSGFVDLAEAAAGADVSAALVAAAAGARGQDTLLVLDGCDHVIGSCVRTISALLRADAGLRVLATSREAFRIAGESVCPVPPLGLGEAVALFTLRMAERNSSVTGVDEAVLEEIGGRLDCLPLAIELAAASCDVMSPADLLRRLDGRIEVLAGGDRSGPVRQQSLAAALDWSFALLEEAEQALLSRLAVFAGTFSLDDAEQVCAGHGLDAHAIFAGIAALAGKSLVGCETNGATVRYCLLTTVQAAVRSASWAQAELAAARPEHVRWCTALAEAASDGSGRGSRDGSGDGDAAGLSRQLDQIAAQYADMTGALTWCRSAAPGAGLRLAVALGTYWQVRGPAEEGCRWLGDLLEPGRDDGRDDGRARLEYGALLYARGEFARARAEAEEALRCFEASQDQPGRLDALMLLGSVRAVTDGPGGGKLLEEIAASAAGGGWPTGVAVALLGAAQAFTGDLAAARRACAASANPVGPAASPLVRLAGQITLGHILLDQGDWPEGQRSLEQARELAQELRFPRGTALAAKGLGTAAAAAGRAGQARDRLAEAVAAAQAGGGPPVLAACLNEQGRLLSDTDTDVVRSLSRQVLATAGVIPAREVATALLGACHADLADGAAVTARSLAEEAAVLARRVGDKTVAARALHAHGLAARMAGDTAAAWSLHREALAIRAEVGTAPGIAESLEALAGVCAGQGRGREAGELFGAADKLRSDLGMRPGPGARQAHARDVALAESAGPAEFERGWARGQRAEGIVTETLSREGRRVAATGWGALTRAEIEVARLAAEGLTNREIGARLFVSPRTVQTHLSHVFGKLEVASRRELTREMRTRTRSLGPAEVPLRRILGLPHETPASPAPAVLGGPWRPAMSWSNP
ncbi:MAG TPA: LuxR C-terminal-related transcriptional regulator [Streptosporangiaceae bacterium]|nr:LuxR C-terminal-related transcriptional regulator [Streptosporangiaceae bacterium]